MDNETLRLSSPMMHGPAVGRLQEMLCMVSNEVCIDGVFGPETQSSVSGFQFDSGLAIDGIVGPKTWSALRMSFTGVDRWHGRKIADIRGMHDMPRLFGYRRRRSDITGVTLHQTGCAMPQHPDGWRNLNAHIGVTQSGRIIIVNDPTYMIWHAQGLSKSTIGIEIEGNYCGIDGDESTLWKGGGGPHHLNPAMMEAFDNLFIWIITTTKMDPLEHICSHRQSAKSRIGDPGEEIWKAVAIPWSERLCVMLDGFRTFGSGRPIPHQWDLRYGDSYNCKSRDNCA